MENNQQSKWVQAGYLYLAPLIVFIITFGFRFLHIEERDIALDEPFTIFHSQYPVPDIIRLLAEGNNPPLYEILLHFWTALFGIDPVSVRTLPLIFGALTAALLFRTGHKFAGIPAGAGAAVMYFFSNLHFYHSLETRVYSLVSLLTAVSLYAYLSLYRKPEKRKYLIILALSNVLLLYSHFLGLFVIFIQCFLLLILGWKKEFLKGFLLQLVLFAVFASPAIYLLVDRFFATQATGTWVQPPRGKWDFFFIFHSFTNTPHNAKYFGRLLSAGLIFILFYPLILKITRTKYRNLWLRFDNFIGKFWPAGNPDPKMFSLFLACFALWFFVPFVTMFFVSYHSPMFMHRYVLFNTIGFYLLVSSAVYILFRQSNLFSLLSVICLGWMASAYFFTIDVNFNYREPAKAVEKVKELRALPGNDLVLIHPSHQWINFMYYYEREQLKDPSTIGQYIKDENIILLWSTEQFEELKPRFPNHNIIYYQDGSDIFDPENQIFRHFDQNYEMREHKFYPQVGYVTYFVQKDNTTDEDRAVE